MRAFVPLLFLLAGCFEQVAVGSTGAPLDPACPSVITAYADASAVCSSGSPMSADAAGRICADAAHPFALCVAEVEDVLTCRRASVAEACDVWIPACDSELGVLSTCLAEVPR